MDLENIINNKDYKIIFLKAILLGINYGESSNSNYYKDSLQKELLKLNKKDLHNEKQMDNEKEAENNIFIQKYKNTLINLENQRLYIINLIQALSNAHYGYNYSKINLLKSNLALIMREIEKNKLLLKNKEKTIVEIPKKNIFGQFIDTKNNGKYNKKYMESYIPTSTINQGNIFIDRPSRDLSNHIKYSSINFPKYSYDQNINLKQKLNNIQYFTKNIENNSIIPEYVPNDIIEIENSKKENLVGELEKTLDNLSSLIVGSE
jgi:hypothetical protein